MKMPKALKKKWLKALRSGEYGQAKGELYDGKGNFCCLGVLEHVAMNGKVETEIECDKVVYGCMPSKEFYEYAGIELTENDDTPVTLSEKNDGGGWGFKRLANWIETNVSVY